MGRVVYTCDGFRVVRVRSREFMEGLVSYRCPGCGSPVMLLDFEYRGRVFRCLLCPGCRSVVAPPRSPVVAWLRGNGWAARRISEYLEQPNPAADPVLEEAAGV